jgi:hypothetical protein
MPVRTRPRSLGGAALGFGLLLMLVSCGSNGVSTSSSAAVSSSPISPSREPVASLVGRWERVNTCRELVAALGRAGLTEMAPTHLTGNGYVPGSAKQLARRVQICRGATPRIHAHFLTEDGLFGSLDWNDEQVDDGTYEIVNDDTFTINDTAFHYRIVGGDTLMLEPVIPTGAVADALEHPDEFSAAAWSVSVAFPGHTWKRVACDGWC